MCLVVFALDSHPRFRLIVAANRDEFHARPAAPATWGVAGPFAKILAGRDLSAGGTWFGVRRDGRWALVTNFREGGRNDSGKRSRGELVAEAINAPDRTQALHALVQRGASYNGFNLLAGDIAQASFASNRAKPEPLVAAGLHGLSNGALDTPWPKVVRTRRALARWIDSGVDDFAPLFEALAERACAPDAELPHTGVPVEWERMLSAPFIVGERYGTRCSTVFTIDRDRNARFHERAFDSTGSATGEVVETFQLR